MENIRRLYENFHFLDKLNREEDRNQKSEIRSNEEVGSGLEEVGSGQFTVGSGQFTVGSGAEVEVEGEDTIGNGQLTVDNEVETEVETEVEVEGEEAMDNGQLTVDNEVETEVEVEVEEAMDNGQLTADNEVEPHRGDTLAEEIDEIDDDEIFIPKTSISFGLPTKPETDPITNETDQPTLKTEKTGTDQQTIISETNDTDQPAIKSETNENDIKPNNGLLDLFDDNPPTIADQYKTNEATLHETITNGEDDSLASKMQKIPINDLKSHIGINDRFRFINELFLASMKDYDEAIDQLNNFDNQLEAIEYFNKIMERYKMDQSLDSFKRLQEFVLRKYL